MRSFFIILLLSGLSASPLLSCGPFYPYGESLRFSILAPEGVGYDGFAPFHYSAHAPWRLYQGKEEEMAEAGRQRNVRLWKTWADEACEEEDIYKAVYGGREEIEQDNSFLRYLEGHEEGKAYLSFARRCSEYNAFHSDPWEKGEEAGIGEKRRELLNEALSRAEKVRDEQLRLRYAFLAVRLAYYEKDSHLVERIHERFFAERDRETVLDHWSLHFRAKAESSGPRRNYRSAQVFALAPSKRMMVHRAYDPSIGMEEALRYAEEDEERAAVWLLDGAVDPGKALEQLKKVHGLNPDADYFGFLLLRELNKLEDWIQTPYYSNFHPALCKREEHDHYESYSGSKERVERDREYAEELLDFLGSIDPQRTSDPLLMRTAEGYLLHLTGSHDEALEELDEVLSSIQGRPELEQRAKSIKALVSVARQPEGDVELGDEARDILMEEGQRENYQLLFAIARELEYKGDHAEGAILLSKLNEIGNKWRNGVYWRTRSRHHTLQSDFYDDYFYYLDAKYSPTQLEELIARVREEKNEGEAFNEWKYSVIGDDLPRLHELLGTKQVRRNELEEALAHFEKVDDTLWTSESYPLKGYFDKDPFHASWYNKKHPMDADTLNKESVTRALIVHLEKAEDPDEPDRVYHYFLAGNCYYNMTQYGNAWMMRRYYWTVRGIRTGLIDDDEYFACGLAVEQFRKAGELSDNERFSALSYAMAGIARDHSLKREIREENRGMDLSYGELYEERIASNPYYKRLEEEYPGGYYEDLVSKCVFEPYLGEGEE